MPPPAPVTVTPTTLTLDVGTSAVVTASRSPKSWTSSNPAVAAIAASGRTCKVTGRAGGQAEVTAKNGPNVGTCRVTVRSAVTPEPPTPEPIPEPPIQEPIPQPPTGGVTRASSSHPASSKTILASAA
jgi:hypothetical protein